MRFGVLEINPAHNPAVLDTATWHVEQAWSAVAAAGEGFWRSVRGAARSGRPLPDAPSLRFHPDSVTSGPDAVFALASLPDSQRVLIHLTDADGAEPLGAPIGQQRVPGDPELTLRTYATTGQTIAKYVRTIAPQKGPQALGALPRLGLGSRMTTAAWPGVFAAMRAIGSAANPIQNSMREVIPLADLLAGRRGETNYGPNLGTFESGHTGSSWEGLWLYGVLAALSSPGGMAYGAEADHIQVKRDAGGFDRALRAVTAARHYTFYTIDPSDILDYGALARPHAELREILLAKLPGPRARQQVMASHRQPYRLGTRELQLPEEQVAAYIAKHWDGLAAFEALARRVEQLREGRPYDLELAIDEVPPGFTACECITSDEELLFVIRECQRRGLPLTHVAPNVGVEKEIDYRCPGGLSAMERRVADQTALAAAEGLILDFHSGDDLARETRRAIGRATAGRCHFKLSPVLQLLYADVLERVCPDRFKLWWEDTLAFARREAATGSSLAADGLRALHSSSAPTPSAAHPVFRHYCFASVGRRDEAGQFVMRDMFYSLPDEFGRVYSDRLNTYLREVAEDVFGQA